MACVLVTVVGLLGAPSPMAAAQDTLPPLPALPPAVAVEEPWGPAHGTTILEIGSIMATGLAIYIYKGERNAYDWPLEWPRIKERFTTLNQFRYDDNEFAMNNVAHPVAGAMYYRFARSNGMGPLGASLYSLAGSTFWEVIVELREIASINDLIATPATGIAIGEAMHRHTEFYRRGAPGFRNSLMDKALSGPILINRLFGEPSPARAGSLTPYGLPADRPHRIQVYGGPQLRVDSRRTGDFVTRKEGWLMTLGASSELGSVEPSDAGGYRETGGLPVTRLDFGVTFTGTAPTELHLGAETVFGGWGREELAERPDGQVRGHRWLVSPATAFTMRLDDGRNTPWMDLLANAHVLGVRADGVVRDGAYRVRWNSSAYADFSSVRPHAIYAFVDVGGGFPLAHSVLFRNQYYYGYGATLRSRLELDVGRVGLRGEIDHHTFESIDGPHRKDPEHGRSELSLSDSRTYARAWLQLRATDRTFVGVGVDEFRAWGRMGDREASDRETRLTLRLTAAPW